MEAQRKTAHTRVLRCDSGSTGSDCKIDSIDIAGNFRHDTALWFDGWDKVSMSLQDIEFHPPVDIECYAGMWLLRMCVLEKESVHRRLQFARKESGSVFFPRHSRKRKPCVTESTTTVTVKWMSSFSEAAPATAGRC